MVSTGLPFCITVLRDHATLRAAQLNLDALRTLHAKGVRLVVTVDCGIRAIDEINQARRGLEFIITDHHDLPPLLPEAYAVVNPKMLPGSHPLRELSGAGCAYKLVEALYDRVGRSADAVRLLDLVALGLVADVAVQTGDTRYLIQRGLEALRHTERLGLRVMMDLVINHTAKDSPLIKDKPNQDEIVRRAITGDESTTAAGWLRGAAEALDQE